MKRFFAIITLSLVAISALAQEPEVVEATKPSTPFEIKSHLANPVRIDSLTVINETVEVREVGDAATIVEQNLRQEPKAVNGYRIVIFMSNSQTARRDAVTAQENFTTLFPNEQSYLSYENPYFKVAVGNCTSQDEAIILLGRLRHTFPKAFIVRESINISESTR